MKSKILIFLFSLISTFIIAQENPITWTTKVEKLDDKEYKVSLIGKIQPGWYIYSQFLPSDDGPVRTTIEFDKEGYELIGKAEEMGEKKEGFDDMFGMNVIKFGKEIEFSQKIKLSANVKNIKATLNYMTCNNEVCLPPKDVALSVLIQ